MGTKENTSLTDAGAQLIDRVLNSKKDGYLTHYHIGAISFKLFPRCIITSQVLHHSHFNYRKKIELEMLSNVFQVTWTAKNTERFLLLFVQTTLAETETSLLVTLLTLTVDPLYCITIHLGLAP